MKDKIISYAALTGENWNTMRVTIKSRESKRAESPKSIAQGNALCNELHPFPSSPERAKSFVNNRLRSEQGSVAHFQFSISDIDMSSLRDFIDCYHFFYRHIIPTGFFDYYHRDKCRHSLQQLKIEN